MVTFTQIPSDVLNRIKFRFSSDGTEGVEVSLSAIEVARLNNPGVVVEYIGGPK